MKTENHLKKIKDTVSDIQKGNLKPVYLLSGEDQYFVFDAKTRFVNALKTLKHDMDVIVLDGEKTSVQNLTHHLFSPSLFNPFQLFVVRNCEWFDKKNRDDCQPLIDWVASGGSRSVLIVTAQSVDRRLGAVKTMGKHGVHLDFPKIKTYGRYDTVSDTYYQIVRERLQARNQTIADNAWKVLRELTIDDGWSVINAVDVVSGYAGEKPRIEKEDVAHCVADSSEFPGYLVVQALGGKPPAYIRKAIEKTLMDGTPPLLLSKTLSNRIRMFLASLTLGLHKIDLPAQYFVFRDTLLDRVMETINAHPDAKDILGGMNPFALFNMLLQLRQLHVSDLLKCLENLAETDRLLKSGVTAVQGLFETALLPVYHQSGNRR
jgi:DNA polymerase III subunit delta